jgi:hypothetical protein
MAASYIAASYICKGCKEEFWYSLEYLLELSKSNNGYCWFCGIFWKPSRHIALFPGTTNKLFATLFLGIQRLEDTGRLPLAHQAMLEEMLECWTLKYDEECWILRLRLYLSSQS